MRLVVVGAGPAGLAAAYRATEIARERGQALDLTLLEARDRLGGSIHTERTGGFVVEGGPDSFLSEKPWALALCRRLGVEDRLVRTDDRYRRTFVWHQNEMHPLPDGFQLLAPTRFGPFLTSRLFTLRGKLRMGLDLVLPRGPALEDESLGSFVRRRLGQEALERVAQPLVAGIYTADPDELSLRATMPRFLDLERRERSIILGLWRLTRRAGAAAGTSGARWSLFVTFREGMGELVEAVASRLPPGSVLLKQRALGMEREGHGWRVGIADGGGIDADAVVLATEAYSTARLLRRHDPALANLLGGIAYASAATVSLGYTRPQVVRPLDGFGFVVPRTEGRDILAATFSSVKYPGRAPEGHVLVRCFLGGMLSGALLDLDDRQLVSRTRAELAGALHITAEPMLVRVARWPASMPQYGVGHLAMVEAIERRVEALPGVALAGAAYRGVGIADCVHSGEVAVERLLGVRPPGAG